ncbi:uncharacterized protein BDR25DRAFT_305792 [Lindgomyces ingoldianus]|uniref:Uncharacterized protein n=1 Tax=Lindgomyces ingoldianus TaxID=673940 RepID=A0ACB6QJA2_9PLEO|nr:uncharacterized protein BDR25DRAFT_305792 [Lindgomyces ingoldianus]KAF2466961.1 hypothetical protein BDR25DRAFT_305792 [Lindgomyces ingoldianus]
MPAMAFLRLCLFAVLNFAARSLQDSKNPLTDFCRRWGHQTAQVDGKLYIDGGLVAWNPLSANPLNYTNTWLLYSDLNTSTTDIGMPQQYANLTKNSTVPSVSGGVLWADEVNKCFYLYGGQYQSNPEDFSFWAYDTILNQWNETHFTSNVNSMQRAAYGAGTQINELGVGFYYGGWINNQTSPGWNGPPMATNNLIKYDMTAGTLNNNTGPDGTGRAEGSMVYLPASDGGLLIYFGGIEDPYKNGSFVGANMSTIHIFDVASSKWYTQNASGAAPPARRQFCAGATWADDHSSYNIYLYGGFGISNITGYDDAYILSLPSFTWIKAWPTGNATGTPLPHGGCSANVINRDQMLIIGGWFTTSDTCDSPNGWGQHNMNLGFNGPSKTLWDKYDPKVSTYFVPTPIISAVGGGPTGGATAKTPSSWDNPDLAVYFTRVPTFSARAATRTIPSGTATPTSTGKSSKTKVGAIAGGVVGGLAFLIAILSLCLFCLHRRKKANKTKEKKEKTPSPPPAELAAASPIHEMASPGAQKYISMHQQPDMTNHPAFSGPNSIHSRSPSGNTMSLDYQHTPTSPYPPQPYGSTTPTSAAPYPSPYGTYPSGTIPYSDNPDAYDTEPYNRHNSYPPPSSAFHQRQSSYPTPTSPNHSQQPHLYDPSQPVTQTYYPPPPDPSHSNSQSRSHQSYSDRIGSPEGTQYSGDTEFPTSKTNTPAHFYAQPAMSGGAGHSPGTNGGERGSLRGSVDRRPVRGRFVEVDHM